MKKGVSPKIIALSFGILTISFLLIFYIFAWQEPSQNPPGGNVLLGSCPSGYNNAGNYCIEAAEHGLDSWDNAVVACLDAGAQLCSAAQWIAACQRGLLTSGAIDDWEWADELTSDVGAVKGIIVGSGGCAGLTYDWLSNIKAYRCCVGK